MLYPVPDVYMNPVVRIEETSLKFGTWVVITTVVRPSLFVFTPPANPNTL